jgi:predicted secreted protein
MSGTVTPHKIQGYKAQLQYTPSGGGSAALIAGLKELEATFKADELDATDHGTSGWKARMLGLLDFEGTAKLDYITGDTSQNALRASLLNQTTLAITILPENATASGEDSYQGTVVITDFKWDGKNNDLQGVQISMKGAGPFSVVAQ